MKFFNYEKRVYAGDQAPPFVNRIVTSPVFMYIGSTGHWWSHCVTIGNRWVLALEARITRGECVSLRLDFLKLGQIEFMVWWPGA